MRQLDKSVDPTHVDGQVLTDITIDFETFYGTDYTLRTMSLIEYILDKRFEVIGVGIAVGAGPARWFTGAHIAKALGSIDWSKVRMIAHNCMFDGSILEFIYGHTPARYMCTMMGARPNIVPYCYSMSLSKVGTHVSYGALTKGLEVHSAKDKRAADFTAEELAAYGGYCRNDVVMCRDIDLVISLDEKEYDIIDQTVRKYTKPQLQLDVDAIDARLLEIQRHKALLLKTAGLLDRDSLMSSAMFGEMLNDLGVTIPMKVSPSNAQKMIPALAKTDPEMQGLLTHNNPAVAALAAARLGHKSTIEETRLERFKSIAKLTGGWLPFPMLYYAAHTGRFGGFDKLNLQNLTRGSVLRQAIYAPDGYTILAPDLSQIEARVLAELAGQQDLLEQFARGDDVYSIFASKVYGYDINKIDNPNERFLGKTAVLGLGFGMGIPKFYGMLIADGMEIDEATVAKAHSTYRSTNTAITKLWKTSTRMIRCMVEGIAMEYKYLRVEGECIYLPGGRILHYPGIYRDTMGDYWYTGNEGKLKKIYGAKLVENIVQALAQIIIRDIELNIKNKLAALRVAAAGQVHDELIYAIENRYVLKVKPIIEKIMVVPPAWSPNLPLECECGVGKTYHDAK